MDVNFKLTKKGDGSVTLEANSYDLFTFYPDGSAFAHGGINPLITGLAVTKKWNRIKLEK